jgi:hypothetical protein
MAARSDVHRAAEIFSHVHVRVVDLMAGTAGELLLRPGCPPLPPVAITARRALASLIFSSEASITAYLEFGGEEARAPIGRHRAAVLAIAEALMIHRMLDAAMIDTIITAAPERSRRADWAKVMENAVHFNFETER